MSKKAVIGVTLGILGVGALALLALRARDVIVMLASEEDEDWAEICRTCDIKGCPRRKGGIPGACKRAGIFCRGNCEPAEEEGEALVGCDKCAEVCSRYSNGCSPVDEDEAVDEDDSLFDADDEDISLESFDEYDDYESDDGEEL